MISSGYNVMFEQQNGRSPDANQLQSSIKNIPATADQNSSMESGSSAEETSSTVHPVSNSCEAMMWDGWAQASNGDEVSTSNLLPELASSSSRLSFQQTDMLSNWLSSFHPLSQNSLSLDLTHNPEPNEHSAAFLHEGVEGDEQSLGDLYIRHSKPLSLGTTSCQPPASSHCDSGQFGNPCKDTQYLNARTSTPIQLWPSLGPESPSSPLALHNELPNSLTAMWDRSQPNSQWPGATNTTLQLLQDGNEGIQLKINDSQASKKELLPFSYTQASHGVYNDQIRILTSDRSSSAINHPESLAIKYGYKPPVPSHTEVFLGPNGNFVSMSAAWAPGHPLSGSSVRSLESVVPFRDAVSTCTESHPSSASFSQQIKFPRRAPERPIISETCNPNILQDCIVKPHSKVDEIRTGKHRLQVSGEDLNDPSSKRQNLAIDHATALWRSHGLRRVDSRSIYSPLSSGLASQAMDIIAVGPALNTNGKPRARRGSATDPQSVYARHRRERINERLKTLQHLVPNGAKVDIVTMLEEAFNYIKFLQHQVELLRSDEYWIFATPNTYNGIDISNPSAQLQGLESSA